MREHEDKRGLYVRRQFTPESSMEALDSLFALAGELERYLERKEQLASKLLRDRGVDPETLWELLPPSDPDRLCGPKYRYQQIDFDSIGHLQAQAFDVLDAIRDIRISGDTLNSSAENTGADRRSALMRGIRLAQRVGHLETNLVFERDVKSRQKSTKALVDNRPKPRLTGLQARMLEMARKLPRDRNRARTIAESIGCSAKHVRKTLKEHFDV